MSIRTPHRLAHLLTLLPALWLAACASLPDRPPAAPQTAASRPQDSTLARIAQDSTPPAKRHLSGLRLLPAGDHALDARLALARQAERTLDAQYYVIAGDRSGRQFLQALQAAAQRGVHVRLLLDDLYSGDVAPLLSSLAAQPQVEVRLFNPLPQRSGSPLTRLLFSPSQFEQLHRRMHNKLFIADGQVAVTGGRNIGDEYFMKASAANFVDMDVLATGAVLEPLTQAFARYWDSAHAYPLQLLQAQGPAAVASAAPEEASAAPEQADLLGQAPVSRQLAQGHLELHYAAVQVLADEPDKVVRTASLDDSALGQGLGRLRQARSEVLIVSPYFIPGERGMAMLREATAAQVRVTVLTNSLAATDEPMVHHAYARYRQALLEMGVNLHELSPRLTRKSGAFGDFRSSDGRLHAKVAVADRRWVLLGSMNMDGRSALANTELGLLIDSPELAWQLRSLLQRAQPGSAWRLRRAGHGIEWVSRDGATELVQRQEPGVDLGMRLKCSLLSLFIDEQLL